MTSELDEAMKSLDYEPERRALQDRLVRYQIAAASERQERDRLVATWTDILHDTIGTEPAKPIDPLLLRLVIDSMEQFLNRSKK